MRKSVAKIALTIFVVVTLLSSIIMSQPGGLLPVTIFLFLTALVIVVAGKGKMRIAGIVCLALSIFMYVNEHQRGVEFAEKRRVLFEKAEQLRSQQTE